MPISEGLMIGSGATRSADRRGEILRFPPLFVAALVVAVFAICPPVFALEVVIQNGNLATGACGAGANTPPALPMDLIVPVTPTAQCATSSHYRFTKTAETASFSTFVSVSGGDGGSTGSLSLILDQSAAYSISGWLDLETSDGFDTATHMTTLGNAYFEFDRISGTGESDLGTIEGNLGLPIQGATTGVLPAGTYSFQFSMAIDDQGLQNFVRGNGETTLRLVALPEADAAQGLILGAAALGVARRRARAV